MKIALCTKQVPDVESVGFNEETKTIVREGVVNEINPFDRRALGQAIELKKQLGAEIVAITMGPPQAADVLRECLSVGADRAVHLCDPGFAGSDTLATARALAAVLKREQADIIFCGKYSVDAETGQVGPEVAELLGIPQVTGATSLQIHEDGKTATVGRETDEGIESLEVDLPVLLTAAERLIRPPRVTPDDLDRVADAPIEMLHPADLGLTSEDIGFKGSPTWVDGIASVKPERETITIDGDNPQVASDQLVQLLLERGLFGEWKGATHQQALPAPSANPTADRAIWVIAEIVEDEVSAVTLELLGGAVDVAQKVNGTVCAVLLGPGSARHASTLAASGAERVYVADHAHLAEYHSETHTHAIASAITAHKPWAVLIPATSNGRDFAPRVAARLQLGLTGDAVGLEVDAAGRLVQLKPAFGGTIVASILSNTFPQMATVRPGMLQDRKPDPSRQAEVIALDVSDLPLARTRSLGFEREAGIAGVELDTAEIVICAGAGLGEKENLKYVDELAEMLDAAVGATRRIVDSGWLPRQQQVGLTGKVLSPQLYIGVAVRGAFNHMIGVLRAGTIVTINNDPNAIIMEHSDIAIVGDYKEIVPALIASLERAKAAARS